MTEPDVFSTLARPGGGNGNGNGNGNGSDPAPVVEEFDVWDFTQWIPGDHGLGRGWLDPANLGHTAGHMVLTLPAGSYDGAEIRSASSIKYRNIEARIRTPDAPGSISAFFLYDLDRRNNDEIDIELLNGTREILFTTWIRGRQTNHVQYTLPFDPSADFHDYGIEWSRDRVRFTVDGVLMQEWTTDVSREAMYVFSNAWWPVWLSGPAPNVPMLHEIDRIVY